jgi:hypothetical protein
MAAEAIDFFHEGILILINLFQYPRSSYAALKDSIRQEVPTSLQNQGASNGGCVPPQPPIFTLLQLISRPGFEVVFCTLNYCRVHCRVS